MSVMPYATVIGVFRNRSSADLAMEALANVGFKRTQMRYLATGNTGGFLDTLKSVFTRVTPDEQHLVSNLTDMGLSHEEVQYFSDEYAHGSALLAIQTHGDEQMALNILYQYGAHNARQETSFRGWAETADPHDPLVEQSGYAASTAANSTPSQEAPVAEDLSTLDDQEDEAMANSKIEVRFLPIQPTSFGFNPQAYSIETSVRDQEATSETVATPVAEVASETTDPYSNEVASETAAPVAEVVSGTTDSYSQEVASETVAGETAEVASGTTVTPVAEVVGETTDSYSQEAASETTATPPEEAVSETTEPYSQEVASGLSTLEENEAPAYSGDQVDVDSSDERDTDEIETPLYNGEQASLESPEVVEVVDIEESATPTPQTEADQQVSDFSLEQGIVPQTPSAEGNNLYSYQDELQQLLAQVEATRQQLQEAREQLELAKGHETQLATARLQLKELQAELQSTQEELQATHQRLAS